MVKQSSTLQSVSPATWCSALWSDGCRSCYNEAGVAEMWTQGRSSDWTFDLVHWGWLTNWNTQGTAKPPWEPFRFPLPRSSPGARRPGVCSQLEWDKGKNLKRRNINVLFTCCMSWVLCYGFGRPEWPVRLSVPQDSVNALYTKCLQHLLRDSHLVSSRPFNRENCRLPTCKAKLFNCISVF